MLIEKNWPSKVLSFWFGELGPEDWFEIRAKTDETIRERFEKLYHELFAAAPSMVFDDPDTALAAIIVFDQFPRNMFRGAARAFATDDLAAAIARKAIERDFDADVPEERKLFFYLPLMHSENVADQEHCVSLCAALKSDVIKYAIEHRDIIARFGRFPHRNRALGRQSTAEEEAFLSGHKGFGQ